MAISITCGGCSATFEVPENLAGKTIRCTSCQSQMTVAATATATAPAKKPFGSGAATKGDEPTPAKTSPNAKPAKPEPKAEAPKPAAKKAAVVVEDDDEDEDEKPAPKAKDKPAAKTAAKKRRDDDDDDDDDDRPRKKPKNKSGGSGAMVGIIAAGVLGLAAIVGLSIFLLSGDKKTDTASNSNNSAPTPGSPGVPSPGMPSPGMPSPGMPGPGMQGPGGMPDTGGPSGPGTPVKPTPGGPNVPGAPVIPGAGYPGAPGGMGPGGPGTPVKPTPGGPNVPGAPVIPGAGYPGAPGGMGPGGPGGPGVPGPVGPGGAGGFGGNPLAGLESLESLGTAGAWAKHTGDGYTADFPGTPGNSSVTQQGIALKIEGVGSKNSSAAMALFFTLPGGGIGEAQMLNLLVQGMQNTPQLRNKQFRDIKVDGKAGKEIDITDATGSGKMQLTVAGNRVYMFIAGGALKDGKPSMSEADQKKFFDSIKITYKSDAVAGGPGFPGLPGGPGGQPGFPGPGGIGQPPFPGGQPGGPGGQPGGPGTGGGTAANTDGNMVTKLDAFVASAFDAENKEFYTFEPRQISAGRFGGTLHRYGYPAFNSLNKLHLSQVGFRAVIDSKGTFLYAAMATSASTVGSQSLDRPSAAGSVAVFDLKALRDSAPKDGSDLKPVATFAGGSTIHGLELSADGKSLFVLQSSGTGNARKSALVRYDTETRKETKRESLPDVARDLVRIDSKTLVILSAYSARTKQAGFMTFDSDQWQPIKSYPVRSGEPVDVAPLPGGGMLVTMLLADAVAPGGGNVPGGPGGIGGPGGFGGQPIGPGGPGGFGGPGVGGPGGGAGQFGNLGGMQPGGFGGQPVGPGGPGLGGPGLGGPGGGRPGGPGAGPGNGPGGPGAGSNALGSERRQFTVRLYDQTGIELGDLDFGAGTRSSNGGYAKYTPDGKTLFLSSWHNAGVDAFSVEDPNKANGLKLKHSIQTAKRAPVGGHFVMTADGKFVVFNVGLVIATNNVGGALGGGGGGNVPGGFPPGGIPGGFPPGGGVPGGIVPPGGVNPGGGVPGIPGPIAPPGGFNPGGGAPGIPGPIVPPGGVNPGGGLPGGVPGKITPPGGLNPGGMPDGVPGPIAPPGGVNPGVGAPGFPNKIPPGGVNPGGAPGVPSPIMPPGGLTPPGLPGKPGLPDK